MKALSVRQPFANLIASGKKRVEFRSWATDYRGPLAIHAGKTVDRHEAARLGLGASQLQPLGAIICVVDLVGCREVVEYNGDEVVFLFEWKLRNPRRVEPIRVEGRLKLFEIGDITLRYATPSA